MKQHILDEFFEEAEDFYGEDMPRVKDLGPTEIDRWIFSKDFLNWVNN